MPSKTTLYPALVTWDGHNGLPKFDAVKDEDFAPAFEAALLSHEQEIDELVRHATQGLNEEEVALFRSFLQTLRNNLQPEQPGQSC